MGRHQIPRYAKRRLVIAGTAAVAMLGTVIGIGIYGNALAEDEPVAASAEQCLPDDPAPAPSETTPPEVSEPPDVSEPLPSETEPPPESPTGEPEVPDPTPSPTGEPEIPDPEPTPTSEPEIPEPSGTVEPVAFVKRQPTSPEGAESEPESDVAPPADPAAPGEEKGPQPADQPPAVPDEATMESFGSPDCTEKLGPFPEDFVNIRQVRPNNADPRPGRNASTGTFVSSCGTNANGHNNPDNYIVAPGVRNGAHHTHDYVGNLSTDGFSTDESLAAAGTTCRAGDKSAYFWPVLRVRDDDGGGAGDAENPHNVGTILQPTAVQLQFRGNAKSKVVAMPDFLRLVTGDAKAVTNGPANANAKWTCTGFTNRITTKYPLCPRGSQVQRISDLPSCWDGENTDSANHRTHTLFPGRNGACPEGTQAVPQLRMTLTYAVPRGSVFAVDAFPEELHNPLTDHGDFENVMPARLMNRAVNCINSGRNC